VSADELVAIGKRVQVARRARNMTQNELAEALNVTTPFLSRVERGKQAMNILTLKQICDILDVSADRILRNNSKESLGLTDSELAAMLADCSSGEREALLKLMQTMKATLRLRQIDSLE